MVTCHETPVQAAPDTHPSRRGWTCLTFKRWWSTVTQSPAAGVPEYRLGSVFLLEHDRDTLLRLATGAANLMHTWALYPTGGYAPS